jgi:hypothetical protein
MAVANCAVAAASRVRARRYRSYKKCGHIAISRIQSEDTSLAAANEGMAVANCVVAADSGREQSEGT